MKNSIFSPGANPKQSLGRRGELHAQLILKNAGWRIITTNWRAGRFAEIDIIAREPGNTLVFVEVKTRKKPMADFGFVNSGFDSIGRRKKEKIMIAASLFMAKYRYLSCACRFDAIIVYYPINYEYKTIDGLPEPEVNHVVGIF